MFVYYSSPINGLSQTYFNNINKYNFSLNVVENKYQPLHFIHSLHTSDICDFSISTHSKYARD